MYIRAPMTSGCVRAKRLAMLGVAVAVIACGCSSLDGRNRNRQGNRFYSDGKYPDAAGEYEKAVAQVDSPTIHYNLALAYYRIFKAGWDKPVLLAKSNEAPCSAIPNVKNVEARVCVREGDRHYSECDDKTPCPSLWECQKATFCSLDNQTIANTAAAHFLEWIKVQPSDDDLKKQQKELQAQKVALSAERDKLAAEPGDHSPEISSAKNKIDDIDKEVDDLLRKSQAREIMTQMWLDSNQSAKAIDYWTKLHEEKPQNPDLMGMLAGIYRLSNDWRTSIHWYNEIANASPDADGKVNAYTQIGNVAWHKLASKTLPAVQAMELSDLALAALTKITVIQPDNPSPYGMMISMFNFRSLLDGASFGSAIDRATIQDLQRQSRVLKDKAKKAQDAGSSRSTPGDGAAQNPPSGGGKTGG
jgi:tetratricopeptide (TPR) repeat protein